MGETPERVRVFAPASVANVGPGFDVFSLAIEGMGDIVEMELTDSTTVAVTNDPSLPVDPARNTASVAAAKVAELCGATTGFSIRVTKGVRCCGGMGSSAASAAAAAAGANALLGGTLSPDRVVEAATHGEAAVAGFHADNVAASVLGGFCIVRYEPIRVRRFDVDLPLALLVPPCEVLTAEARKVVPTSVDRGDAVANIGNAALIVVALKEGDHELFKEAMVDRLAEPYRTSLIPGYEKLKRKLAERGVPVVISGAGPSVFVPFPPPPNELEELAARLMEAEVVRTKVANTGALGSVEPC